MKFIGMLALATAFTATCAAAATPRLAADIVSSFVSPGGVPARMTRPAEGPAPHVAVIYENGRSIAPMCEGLARRGFLTFCAIEGPHPQGWEDVALDIASLVRFARQQPGITRVVLYGHSGGGSVASFYQATAENGVAFCQDPRKLFACSDRLRDLPPADGVVFPDAHPGLGVMALREMNPSLSTDGRRLVINPALDPYNPANGFNPHGPSHYSQAFVDQYTHAQAAAMNALLQQAQAVRAAVVSGAITDASADRVVRLGGSHTAHLDELDPGIAATEHSQSPRRLLRNDGAIVVVPIVSSSAGDPSSVPHGPLAIGALTRTTAEFLSRDATPARDSLVDFDICASNSNTLCNAGYISAPSLFIPSGANNFIRDEERMFERSPAKDKEYIVVEGALHSGEPCKVCETSPGQFSNSLTNLLNYVTDWINKRF